jgi:hypothetical protein
MPGTQGYCSSRQNHCYISKAQGGSIFLEPTYNMEFNQALKDHVPKEHRRWDPQLRRWWISMEYAQQARIDAKAFFENVIEI